MSFLYNIVIFCLGFLIKIASLFNSKAKLFVAGRINQNLNGLNKNNSKKRIWIHVSSLGEFEQGRPVIEALNQNSNIEFILTFYSPSGYEIRKNYEFVKQVLYLPIDTPKNAKNFLDILQPDLVIFVKYDFWFNYLNECVKRKIPLIFISTKFNENQWYFTFGKSIWRPIFQKITHFFVQDEHSKKVLQKFNISQITRNGDTRIDRVINLVNEPKNLDFLLPFIQNSEVFIFGSVWPSDIKMLVAVIQHFKNLKFIIAPHDIGKSNIHYFQNKLDNPLIYSEWKDNPTKGNILIIDNIGLLQKLYAVAKYAYIGGAFKEGLHNILEPATYGIPVFFGDSPNNKKFNEAQDLIEEGGAFAFTKSDDLVQKILELEENKNLYQKVASSSKNYILKNAHATEEIVKFVIKHLS